AGFICRAVQTRASKYFNDEAEARELLDEWGIRGSEDVGNIACGMAKHGLIPHSDGNSITQFAGIFSLQTLFTLKP
ncbi:MAG TPA: hypothetical protein VGG44_10565, partial [Tepidisphaeraceae bacterium]